MGVSEFLECDSHGTSVAGDKEGCTDFGFHGRAHYVTHDFGEDVYRTVGFCFVEWCGFEVEWVMCLVLGFVSKEVETTGTAFGVRFREVRRVTTRPEMHVTGCVADGSIGVGRAVV